MIAGHGTPDQAPARLFAYRHPEAMEALIDMLAEHVGGLSDPPDRGRRRLRADLRFLGGRARRGRLSRPIASRRWREIVGKVRAAHPDVPDHRLPEGRGRALRAATAEDRRRRARARLDGAAVARRSELQARGRRAGQSRSAAAGRRRRGARRGRRRDPRRARRRAAIFNLGHGITPETPIAHVEAMVAQVAGERDDEQAASGGSGGRRCSARRWRLASSSR